MRAFTFKEYIDRPPARVWEVLVDLSVAPRWRPLVKSSETEDGLPVHDGSRIRLTIEFLGRVTTRVSETIAFEPQRRWTLRSGDAPALDGVFDFLLEPTGTGTTVVATCHLHAHAFLPWLFLPMIAHGERRRRIEMLPNLKRFVEGRSV
jgi:uncharacterized protein YndB with AHSA1/START domain